MKPDTTATKAVVAAVRMAFLSTPPGWGCGSSAPCHLIFKDFDAWGYAGILLSPGRV